MHDPEQFSQDWVKFRLEEANRSIYTAVVTNEVPAADRPVPNPAGFRDAADAADQARVLAVGEWTTPIPAASSARLRFIRIRGRLLVYEMPSASGIFTGDTMICLELAYFSDFSWETPPIVYFDPQRSVEFELRDDQGRPVAPSPAAQGTAAQPSWASIPVEGTLKLRVDRALTSTGSATKGLILTPWDGCSGKSLRAVQTPIFFRLPLPRRRTRPIAWVIRSGTRR